MEASSWLYVALIAFLIFCCGSMLFMGRHKEHSTSPDKTDARTKASEKE